MKARVLVIVGPTASGKKNAALQAAEHFDGEIISADSRKVYRYLDIGTAKPSLEVRKRVPHHLIDILDPDEHFSAGEWLHRASEAAGDIVSRGKIPIISGGTGFYIKAFRDGLSDGISSDPEVRKKLEKELENHGAAAQYKKLKEIDPSRAAELHENDSFRVLRALEIFYTTGKTFTEMRESEKFSGGDYDYFSIGIEKERKELFRCIDDRAEKMVSNGLLDEIKALISRGYSRDIPAFDTVGYKEWFPYLDGGQQFESCLEQMKLSTRQYAKRQMTWFRAQPGIRWTDPEETNMLANMSHEIDNWLVEK